MLSKDNYLAEEPQISRIMGLDGLRVGGGRCPPLFVGGLLVACFFLVCNWWSLSTENLELLRQLDELNEHLKISAEERDECTTLRQNMDQRYKSLKDEVGTLHVRLQQLNSLKMKNDEVTESLTMCKSELDSLNKLDATKSATLETLRLEKDTMATQLATKKEENKKLMTDLEAALSNLEKLKLSVNIQNEKAVEEEFRTELTEGSKDKAQLGPVDESAVQISVSGQRGMKYHGVPILPRDPPGVSRQSPRLSVTMLKAPTSNTVAANNLANIENGKENVDEANGEPSNNANEGEEESHRFIEPDEHNKNDGEQQN
ncbi:uncharacterized protein [Venturia canescens]|uniref:uncharacterized protein isoform X2 n=1 Tax=Venturia canescens TaxID=32260 RepID=UPI001C9C5394|nr:uncharacterized protein LOC122414298 isoform X2 [Venturia canescens]